MKKYIWIIVLVVGAGLVWMVVRSFLVRKGAEAIVESTTGGQVNYGADNSVTYTNEEGSVSTSNTLPANWPSDVPNYPGATVVYSGYSNPTDASSGAGAGATFTTPDDNTKVAAYYRDNLVKQGWQIAGESTAASTNIISATKDSRNLAISISRSENLTSIVVGIDQTPASAE